jgi:putative iron-regulated protein
MSAHRSPAFLAFLALASCGPSAPPDPTGAEVTSIAESYADLMYGAYDDAIAGARALEVAIDALLAEPSAATLEAARQAWVASRPAYLETEVSRFYDGPIDDPDTGREGAINAWPLDEAYVDYVRGGDGAPMHVGIVNDPAILATIDADGLAMRNQDGSEENVSTGYHAIEFLLWGQDLRTDGAGDRAATDYLVGAAMNVERRRAYLSAAIELLIDDLEHTRDAWAPGVPDNYRASFVAEASASPREVLRRILVGMGSLSGAELSGERMNVAYMTKEQEDEHSCFSDTTTQDQLHDAIGIRNVYLARATRADGSDFEGASLADLVAARDPALDARMREQLDASVAAVAAIPAPFDQAILGSDTQPGRVAIRTAIDALRAQTRTTADIARLFDVQLNLEE